MNAEQATRERKKALVVVAHPDDETIWMGGMILKNKDVDWTCFSLCRESDADRAPKFRKVCAYYGAKAIITDLDDEGNLSDSEYEKETEKLIKEKIKDKEFDYIFTHGQNGEYGHPGHIQVHKAVKNLLTKRIIKTEQVFYFNYKKKNEEGAEMIPAENSNLFIQLNPKEIKEKKRIMNEMYGFSINGLDVGYCTKIEAFK